MKKYRIVIVHEFEDDVWGMPEDRPTEYVRSVVKEEGVASCFDLSHADIIAVTEIPDSED